MVNAESDRSVQLRPSWMQIWWQDGEVLMRYDDVDLVSATAWKGSLTDYHLVKMCVSHLIYLMRDDSQELMHQRTAAWSRHEVEPSHGLGLRSRDSARSGSVSRQLFDVRKTSI
jgi:hypothetical protein